MSNSHPHAYQSYGPSFANFCIGLNIVRIWSRFTAFDRVYWTAIDSSEASVLPGRKDNVSLLYSRQAIKEGQP